MLDIIYLEKYYIIFLISTFYKKILIEIILILFQNH